MSETCKDCRWCMHEKQPSPYALYRQIKEGGEISYIDIYRCHVNPPQPRDGFPGTRADYFCSQFAARKVMEEV